MKVTKPRKKRPDLSKIAKVNVSRKFPWLCLKELVVDLSDKGLIDQDTVSLMNQIIRDRDFEAYLLLDDLWGLQSIAFSGRKLAEMRALYQLSAFLKKFQFPSDEQQLRKAAIRKFDEGETNCWEFNHGGSTALTWPNEEWMPEVFTYAKNWIRKVLGESPNQKQMREWTRHGPGSALSTVGELNSSYFKYEQWPYDCTKSAIPYAMFAIRTNQRWYQTLRCSYAAKKGITELDIDPEKFWEDVFMVVPGNRIDFVPKNAKTMRSIAIEPKMNLFLQLGVDGFIRRRLKRFDIDLDDQRKNQRLAQSGSIDISDEQYVTIDMKGASDSIATLLCSLLLPLDWFHYLCSLRSPVGTLKNGEDSHVYVYEKISSMGNGFTFALESLIFAAITQAVIHQTQGTVDFRNDMAVFGDDIICRKNVVEKVVCALQNCGFQLNLDKSFLSGSVKESCGTDWVDGNQVRPVYLKEYPTNVFDLISLRNRMRRMLRMRYGIQNSKAVRLIEKRIPDMFKQFIGPNSNEEFESYLHADEPWINQWTAGCWKYRRLLRKPVQIRGKMVKDLHWRKLMHDLKPDQPRRFFRKKESPGGNRFAVILRNAYTVGVKSAYTSNWYRTYEDLPLRDTIPSTIEKIVEGWRKRPGRPFNPL